MDTPEMTDVSVKVELFRNNRVSGRLLQIETSRRDEVTRGEKVR